MTIDEATLRWDSGESTDISDHGSFYEYDFVRMKIDDGITEVETYISSLKKVIGYDVTIDFKQLDLIEPHL